MKSQYINAAASVVSNKQQLINMVSKRVRELSAGSWPMIEVDYQIGQMGLADIALAEIAGASSPHSPRSSSIRSAPPETPPRRRLRFRGPDTPWAPTSSPTGRP